MSGEAILYFDGVCGLCNRFVDWLLRRDRKGRIRFAPLQGATAAARLPANRVDTVATVVLERDGRFRERSSAAIEAIGLLGGAWRAVLLLKVVPRPVRDAVYDAVARRRYAWFGRLDHCRVPSASASDAFLP